MSQPGNIFEEEADRIAETIAGTAEIPVIQHKSIRCNNDDPEGLLRKEAPFSEGAATLHPETLAQVRAVLNSPGQYLDPRAQTALKPYFGHNFSRVRVHTDRQAAESAHGVNALAYTVGQHIVFGAGQYAPATAAGQRLLAHELVHTIQQDEGGQPIGILQRQPAPSTPTGTSATATSSGSTAPAANACNQQDLNDITAEALTWLDDAYGQLVAYTARELLQRPDAIHQRVGAAMQQAFNTTDLNYVEVVRRRLLHIATTLRQANGVSITCGGPHCTFGGTSLTAAYVTTPYALVMCNVGTSGNRPIGTFIHELCHAILPQVGIGARITSAGGGVRDRAYTHERVYQHLTPEEALDNASSYAVLVDLLHRGVNQQVVTQQADTTPGCTQPTPVLNAFARAEQWNRFAGNTLDSYITYLAGRPPSNLPSADLTLLTASFPAVTTTAQLQALQDAYESLQSNGFNVASWDLACARPNARRCRGVLGYTEAGRATASSVTLARVRTTNTITVCSDWFTASDSDKIRSIYALFLISRPAWIVAGFQLRDAFKYVDFAGAIVNSRAPAPATTSAMEHIRAAGGSTTPRPANPPAPSTPSPTAPAPQGGP